MKTIITKFKTSVLAIAIFTLTSTVFGQGQPEQNNRSKEDRINQIKIAYFSQQLNLSPGEAEKFWPVYNQYQNDLKGLRQNFKPGGPNNQLSAEQQLDFEQKHLDLKKRYKGQFEGALGREKVNRLYNVEREFREKLKGEREQRQQMKGNQGPRLGRGQFGNR